MAVKSFRELQVWRKGVDLAARIYEVTGRFPRSATYGLASQMQRAAGSVPANIAEGQPRRSTKEFRRYLDIAMGSLAELETHVEIANRVDYLTESEYKDLLGHIGEIGRMINGLRKSLKNASRQEASDH